jgi:pimeloyl-ACP methyl ester carboxylesterase
MKISPHQSRPGPSRRGILSGAGVAAAGALLAACSSSDAATTASTTSATGAGATPSGAAGRPPSNSTKLSLLGGKITGLRQAVDGPTGMPLVVFIHGGNSQSIENDIPGHSRLDLAVRQGFSAFALDRPGSGGSEALDFAPTSEDGLFEANAERIGEAIAEIWADYGTGSSGVVVCGSSVGAAVSLTLASQWSKAQKSSTKPTWPLLGLGSADIGQDANPAMKKLFRDSPVTELVDDASAARIPDTAPAWTSLPGLAPPSFKQTQAPTAGPSGSATPKQNTHFIRAEVLEVTGSWADKNWKPVVSSISVPVHYRLAQYDDPWTVRRSLVNEFADALRTGSPYVNAAITAGAKHPIHISLPGDAYNLELMSFISLCHIASQTPELLKNAVPGQL